MVTLKNLEKETVNYNLTDSLKELSFDELQCCFYNIISKEIVGARRNILECLIIELQYRGLTLDDMLYSEGVSSSRKSRR
jgi:hypothetical protein